MKETIQIYFKEFVRAEWFPTKGFEKIKKAPNYVCDLFVYEPRSVEEAYVGSLFMLGKIENVPKNKYRNFDLLLNLLISVIKREFYSDHTRPTSEALEAALSKANVYLADFTEKGNDEWVGNLHFICGAFSNNALYLSQIGESIIKLFRGTSISHIENKFPEQKKSHPLKTFNNIVSGVILDGDKIILATQNLLDVASVTALKKIASGSIEQIINEIKNLTENKASKQPLICLAVEAKSGAPEIINVHPFVPKENLAARKQNKPVFFVASLLIIFVLILPFVVAQKINYRIKTSSFNKLSDEILEIQKQTDAALIYQDKEKAKGLIQRNQLLVASLLEFLKRPPLKTNENSIKLASGIQEKYQEQEDNISNTKRIKNPEEILDFSKSGFIVNPVAMEKFNDNLYFFELESGILYKFDLASANQGLNLVFISAKDELRKMTILENGQVAVFGQSGKTYIYDNNANEHNAYSLEPNIDIENIKDVKGISSNFYVLDSKNGALFRYSLPAEKEIIKGDNWLSETTEEIKNAQSMDIDGSVYILDNSGKIIRYFKGKKAEEINPLLDKPLEGENKIFIKAYFQNIYISDPKNKRLIVLNKSGEIINQYVNDDFLNLKDFFISKDEKEAYLLCGKMVYKINL